MVLGIIILDKIPWMHYHDERDRGSCGYRDHCKGDRD
jgi:hypothetical protein